MIEKIRSTTVICVRRDGKVVMAGDGQVTLGHEVLKSSAKKLRRLYNDKILAGFAGSTADAFSLSRASNRNSSSSTETFPRRSGVSQGLAHRQNSAPSRSPAAGRRHQEYLHVSGNGMSSSRRGCRRHRSGGPFATAAATALLHHTKLSAKSVVQEAMSIAGKICIYTNENISYEELG